ncbi:hypothetical protein GCM10025795_43930 [Verticiella sediminum]
MGVFGDPIGVGAFPVLLGGGFDVGGGVAFLHGGLLVKMRAGRGGASLTGKPVIIERGWDER